MKSPAAFSVSLLFGRRSCQRLLLLLFAVLLNSLFIGPVALVSGRLQEGNAEESAEGRNEIDSEVDFESEIAPILVTRCLQCHQGEAPDGNLDLSSSAGLMAGGDSGSVIEKSNDSLLLQRVLSEEMPPEHPLPEQEKQLLQRWVQQGAKWDGERLDPFRTTSRLRAGRDWWSLQPLRPSEIPKGEPRETGNWIDRFVSERLNEDHLPSTPVASGRQQLRRVYFDLVGLPPTPEQVSAFEANPTDQAYQTIVNELLDSHHYGERWGRHWLDIVRFGESDGFERNFQRDNAWPYRDWVIQAFNKDLPYDEFARMQLAGDTIQPGKEGTAATGFWVAGVHNTVVGGSKRMVELARQDEIEDVLATVGQSFLGLTLNCARCHDHKFDPITQKEYYQLVATVAGLGFGEKSIPDPELNQKLAEVQSAVSELELSRSKRMEKARSSILESRPQQPTLEEELPVALARWTFEDGVQDSLGQMHGELHGSARVQNGSLVLDGSGYVSTTSLEHPLAEKTLEAWVQLDQLEQRGGGVVSVQTMDGLAFDAIVFGEQEPGRWLPGSDLFRRTSSFSGTAETEANSRPVHLAWVYESDGFIRGYRDGVAYGQPVRVSDLIEYSPGTWNVLFGLRHFPPGGNRFLTGKVLQAALYDRALSPEEIRRSAKSLLDHVPESEVMEYLANKDPEWRELETGLDRLRRQRDELKTRAEQKIFTLVPAAVGETRVYRRGDPALLGETVVPAAPQVMALESADFGLNSDAPESLRRQKLAEWITAKENPLFSRVIVNRVWHYHFGRGLVSTPSDFGFNGSPCSHPELLDHLSDWFVQNNYSMKALHRLIVNSDTYRKASRVSETESWDKAKSLDRDNRLLWRGNPRRLEAETLRDSMLVVAGKLNEAGGGPGYQDVSIVLNSGTTYYEPIPQDSEKLWRRTVYRFTPRGGRSSLLDTFDCPDPAATTPKRSVTTTPLQSLSLLNNDFVIRMSKFFAQRVQREAGQDPKRQVDRCWKLAIGRSPDPEEREQSLALLQEHGLAALCRGIFNFNEFVVID